MTPEWFSTPEVQSLGQGGYLQYLVGIAIINAPSKKFARGIIGEGTRDPLDVLVWGEEQMVEGLADVIRAANPQAYDLKTAGEHFDNALPLMQRLVDETFISKGDQIRRMNRAFKALRPLAAEDGNTYRSICHSNYNRLQTVSLMRGVQPAEMFMDFMRGPGGRTVRSAGNSGSRQLHSAS